MTITIHRPHPTTVRRRAAATGLGLGFALALSGCAGFGNLGTAPGVTTVTLASVNNPQMQDMAQLLPEFEKLHPDIKINIIFMEENDLRNATTKDVATQGGQYDVMTVGAYEVPIWGQNRWLMDLTDKAAEDPSYDVNDFFKPVRDGVSYDNRLYAVPFYGESSFLMYRKDLFKQAGITMPERPTWDQIAEYAAKLKDPSQDRAGICLRAKPGWGEMFAPLTTVVNTFGGQWYNMDWQAQVNSPAFTRRRQVLHQHAGRLRRGRPGVVRLHRVPEPVQPGPGGNVVRRHLGRRFGGGPEELQGRRRGRLCPGAGAADPELGLAVVVEPRHQRGVQAQGRGLDVRQVGHLQAVRPARRIPARLVPDATRHAEVDVSDPAVHQGRWRVRTADGEDHERGESEASRVSIRSRGSESST